MSGMKNLPLFSAQISAWAREISLDLKANLFDLGVLVILRSGRSVKRPILSGASPSLTLRAIGSNLKAPRVEMGD